MVIFSIGQHAGAAQPGRKPPPLPGGEPLSGHVAVGAVTRCRSRSTRARYSGRGDVHVPGVAASSGGASSGDESSGAAKPAPSSGAAQPAPSMGAAQPVQLAVLPCANWDDGLEWPEHHACHKLTRLLLNTSVEQMSFLLRAAHESCAEPLRAEKVQSRAWPQFLFGAGFVHAVLPLSPA